LQQGIKKRDSYCIYSKSLAVSSLSELFSSYQINNCTDEEVNHIRPATPFWQIYYMSECFKSQPYKRPSAGRKREETLFRKGGRNGSPQSGKPNAVGTEDEQHPQRCYGSCFKRAYLSL